jgi:hypothetical protein
LKKQIVPLPVKEPSNVLFELMNALIQSGKELASVAEIFVGKMPGQNTPATTTMASIDQGMKVFTAVYKRIYRSLDEEFQKLYRLNGLYLNPNTYVDIVDMEVGPDDFNPKAHKIFPSADPSAMTQSEKLQKAEGLMQLLGGGMPLDPVKVMIRVLESQEQPNWQELVPPQIMQTGQMPPPPPDPKLQAVQAKTEADQAKAQNDIQVSQQKAALDTQTQQAQLQMKAQEHAMNMQAKQADIALTARSKQAHDQMRVGQDQAAFVQKMMQESHAHEQSMQQSREQHAVKLKQQAQTAKAKPSKGAKK